MRRILYIALVTFLLIFKVNGQTDNEFWFVAPAVTPYHNWGGGQPVFFHITTREIPATVTIEMPANSLYNDTTFTIAANSTYKFNMNYSQIANEYDLLDGIIGKNNKGFHITSTSLITIYYEYSNVNNPDIWALKGRNALGTEFYSTFQTHMYNQNTNCGNPPCNPALTYWPTQAYSSFDIVATEDNTIVTIETSKPIYGHELETVFTITLNKGQTYSAVPARITIPPNGWKASDIFGRSGTDHLSGCRITTNGKKIAISLKDDSVKSLLGGCYDLTGEQTVPTSLIGTEYIAMKGQLDTSVAIKQERVYILSTQNNDSIFINNVYIAKQNKGSSYMYQLTKSYYHIRTKYPSYVLQVTGFGCEIGSAVLPSISKCTGSTSVSFTRSTNEGFFMNIMVRKGAEAHFRFNGAYNAILDSSVFQTVPGSNIWLAARLGPFNTATIPIGSPSTVSNTEDVFHIGIINGAPAGGTRYGYFSDYSELNLEAFNAETGSQYFRGCDNDSIQLIASGGANYTWKPNYFISNIHIATPKVAPPITTQYTVKATGACDLNDSAILSILVYPSSEASFNLDKTTGCSPFKLTFNSIVNKSRECRWYFGNANETWTFADTVSFDTTFSRTYINNSDTIQNYQIMLIVYSKAFCSDTLIRYIKVYPGIKANFSIDKVIGCQPLSVNYTNLSTGNVDTTNYLWKFGDGEIVKNKNASHTFTNIGTDDSIYVTTLIATSPFLCQDSITKNIVVHPIISANYTIDTTLSCSDHNALIYNQSVGVDTFKFDFGDSKDTSMLSFSRFNHKFYNTDTVPLYYKIKLTGKSKEACLDTISRTIRINPRVTSNFSYNPLSGCDSTEVQFTNLSLGYMLNFYWDFGDSNTSKLVSPKHIFLNKTENTINYKARLTIESKYHCLDTTEAIIPIYPYLKAVFSVDSSQGCNPFPAIIKNKSVGADLYNWSFGDGNVSALSDTLINHNFINSSFIFDTIYPISLIVTNAEGCKDTLVRDIKVFHDIKSSFNPDKISSCDPAIFNFYNHSQGAQKYIWNLGDSSYSTVTDSLIHKYAKNNSITPLQYNVSLLVLSNDNNCFDFSDTVITVNPYLYSEFSIEQYIGCSPFTNRFINSSYGKTNTYKWFVDGSQISSAPSDSSDFISQFRNTTVAGSKAFEIILTARNPQGCQSIYLDSFSVYSEVDANFGFNPSNKGCSPFFINFEDSSKFANKYYWNMGDNTSSNLTSPSHLFTNLSFDRDTVYNIKLVAESDHCKDSITKPITVFATPNAAFNVDTSFACPPFDITAYNTSLSTPAKFNWFFGDGDTKTETSLVAVNHTYQNIDTIIHIYPVKLKIVTNNGCIDSTTSIVQSYPQVISNFTFPNAGCSPLSVSFTDQSKNSDYYMWNFGNSIASVNQNPTQIFVNYIDKDTIYNIKLRTSSAYGCKDSITKQLTVYPSPVAKIYVFPSQQKYVEFPNVSITNEADFPNTWTYNWSFGDGKTGSQKDTLFNHQYLHWGPNSDSNRFYISLILYNPNHPQCRDTANTAIFIFPPQPEAVIQQQDSTGCEPLTLNFNVKYNYSYPDSTIWDFGDGTVIKGQSSVSHTYQKEGVYYIKLRVVGDGGPSYDYQFIKVYKRPIADFDADPKTLILPKSTVQFTNKSKFGNTYSWDFGDGVISIEEDPVHTYSDSGTYSIRFVVTSQEGCEAIIVKENLISVDDPAKINFPNAFKPNPSGPSGGVYSEKEITSAIFRPVKEGVLENDFLFQVFNRWGELLFETTDINKGWDGYYDGQLCKQDVYVFVVKGRYFNGTEFIKKGTITLLQ